LKQPIEQRKYLNHRKGESVPTDWEGRIKTYLFQGRDGYENDSRRAIKWKEGANE